MMVNMERWLCAFIFPFRLFSGFIPFPKELYVDTKSIDSKKVDVGTSGASVTLQWLAQAGEHSYTVKVYRLVDSQELWEDSRSGSVKVAKDPDGLYAWLKVMPDRVDPGDNVVAFVTIENTADYAQTWPVELVDNTGNIWWPNGTGEMSANYSLYSDGSIKIYAHKVARIMVTGIKVYQNTTFYLKVAGVPMASAYVEVNDTPYLELTTISRGDLWLNPTSRGLSDNIYISYGGTVDCRVGFINPHDKQVGVQLEKSRVSVDFPMSHSTASITDGSTTVYPAHSSGSVHVRFSASIDDFSALAKYWVYGYYDLPITIRLHLAELMDNNYHSYNYTIRSHVTVKTSNSVYGVVVIDLGSFIASGESLKGVLVAVKAGERTKAAWEIFKVAQGFIRGILKRW